MQEKILLLLQFKVTFKDIWMSLNGLQDILMNYTCIIWEGYLGLLVISRQFCECAYRMIAIQSWRLVFWRLHAYGRVVPQTSRPSWHACATGWAPSWCSWAWTEPRRSWASSPPTSGCIRTTTWTPCESLRPSPPPHRPSGNVLGHSICNLFETNILSMYLSVISLIQQKGKG